MLKTKSNKFLRRININNAIIRVIILLVCISEINIFRPIRTYAITYNDGVNSVGYLASYENIIKLLNPIEQAPSRKFESVHITNAPEYLYLGYKYPLDAKPYPFSMKNPETNKPDFYDLRWTSSDNDIAYFLDDLLIPVKEGTVTVTVRIAGTNIKSSTQIKIKKKPEIVDKVINIDENYVSENGGYKFNLNDPEETTRAIYAAITEANDKGYNHIVFPKINFHIQPIGMTYIIPSGMTVEFPEGSILYMVENSYAIESSNHYGYVYFSLGYTSDDSFPKKADGTPDYSATYSDSKLLVDQYYGERYNTTHDESYFTEHCVFISMGRRAQYSTIEIHNANSVAGFFIGIGGSYNIYELKPSFRVGGVYYTDFQHGKLDEAGNLNSDENWISSVNYTQIPEQVKARGRYNIGPYYAGNNYGVSGRLYNIFWYDEDYNLIGAYYWKHLLDNYDLPEGAAYFRVSVQQQNLPTSNFMNTEDYCVIRINEDAAVRFGEVKNTHVTNSASGMLSMTGETDGCYIHDNYTSWNGHKNTWAFDFEDGWKKMRHNIVEGNTIKGQTGFSGGYHNFIINNVFEDIDTRVMTENNRIIHNYMRNMEMGEGLLTHFYANEFMYPDYSNLIYANNNPGHVIDYRPANGISLDKSSLTMKEGENTTLTATVSGHRAYGYKVTNKTVIWSSSDTNVADVDNSGKVIAKSVGTAVITATAQDNGKTSTCTVTVNGEPDSEINSLEWEREPVGEELEIEKGTKFKYAGKAKVTYKSGYSKVVDVVDGLFSVSNFDANAIGEQVVTLIYKNTGFTLQEKVNVVEKAVAEEKKLIAIEWVEQPNEGSLKMKKGSDYKYSGTAKLIYNNDTYENVKVTKDNFILSGFDANKVGYQDLILTYKDTKLTLSTRVHIELDEQPVINDEKPVIKDEQPVIKDEKPVINKDTTSMEWHEKPTVESVKKEIPLPYENKVVTAKLTGIVIKDVGKTEYTVGDTIDISKLVVYAVYDDNTSRKLSTNELSVTYEDLDKLNNDTVLNKNPEKRIVTVAYRNFTSTYEINLKPKTYKVTVEDTTEAQVPKDSSSDNIDVSKTKDDVVVKKESNSYLWLGITIVAIVIVIIIVCIFVYLKFKKAK